MRINLLSASLLALAVTSLSACGGGSTGTGVKPIPTPTPTPGPGPTPTPTPTPQPTPIEIEAGRSNAAISSKAGEAYARGFTGKDVTIAIIDSGIDTSGTEFDGRISDKSKSFEARYASCMTCAPESVTFDLDDVQGHGTKVASIAAGAKDGKGIHGIAYDATILALKIVAPDLNSPAGGQLQESGLNATAIAPALRYAVDNGAFAINMSLNGTANGAIALDQRAAMDHVRNNNRLVVMSISNTPGEDSFAGQFAENMVGADFANKEWFLFGLGLTADLKPVDGNGVPGALADRTLSVPGWGVNTVDKDGNLVSVSGNSFAAPAIAGAAALLKQYWPQLGGKEISQILLSSATDMGAPGADQIYGAGLLNIEAAFKADAPTVGTSTIRPSSVDTTALVFSPAFGGSAAQGTFSEAAGQGVAIDRFGRDYKLNMGALTGSIRSSGVSIASLAQPQNNGYSEIGNNMDPAANFAATYNGRQQNNPAAQFGFRVSPKLAFAGAINSSIDSSELMTGSMLRSSGLATFGSSFDVYADGHRFSFGTASNGNGSGRLSSTTNRFRIQSPEGFAFGLTTSKEVGSALGMQGSGAFNIEGARSMFATSGWAGNLAGVQITAESMIGRTKVKTRNSMLEFNDDVISSGFRFQAERAMFGGMALLGLTSPLKVEQAQVRYTAAVAYDLETRSLIDQTSYINLAPSAREYNVELGWARALGKGQLSLGAAYGMNSGNVQGQQSAAGWLRYGARF